MTSLVAPYVPAEALRLPAALPLSRATPNVFVVPAHNEQENLPRLLADLEARPELFPPESRLIVVDDGSLDATAELVEAYAGPLPVELVRLEQNQGPGAAFRAGFAAALGSSAGEALVVTLEADTTCDLDALPEMLARAAAGAELVLASVHGGGHMLNVSACRRLLSHCASAVMRLALGVQARTVSSFFRVYRASALREAHAHYGDLLIRETGFACKAELLAKLTTLGARVEEIPVDVDGGRRVGKSNMRVLPTLLAYWRLMVRQAAGWERMPA
ncbi:MAG TPA: glycosyltransferase [Gaiellaceae bacterium]|jgi:dolichol-phosphate mannosyltransferase|nr:glycosyltransferase [Gaiellaceae bacterium]